MKKIGKIKHGINVSEEYTFLAEKDEEVARILKKSEQYRHSIYFFIQAMEKHIRAKIFELVNPNLEYFRKKNQNHSLDNAVEFLVEIIATDINMKNQIKLQIDEFVFEGIKFNQLHNNLRYPFYNEKYNNYSIIEFNINDCIFIEEKNKKLKKFLLDLNRI